MCILPKGDYSTKPLDVYFDKLVVTTAMHPKNLV